MKSHPSLWLTGLLVLGVLIGLAWPPPPIPRSQQAAEDAAPLPSAVQLQRFSADAFKQTRTGVRWLGDKAEGGASGSGEWRLTGILTSAKPAILVLKSGGDIGRFAVGSTLPDGSKLTLIDKGKVVTELDSCRRVYQMYRDRPIESSTECGDPISNTQQVQP